MAKGTDTGSHPKRKVGREDYHTSDAAGAADFAQSNAQRMSYDSLQKLARSGRTMTPEERDDYYEV